MAERSGTILRITPIPMGGRGGASSTRAEAEEDGREDGAEGVGEHVFLGVPDVALAAEEGGPGGPTGGGGVPPLDQLVAHGDEGDGEDREEKEDEAAADRFGSHEGLGDSVGVEADGEVGDAIVVVALKTEGVGHEAEGDAFESVVSADGVHVEQHGHEDVGGWGENEPAEVEDNEGRRDQDDGDILGPPGGAVVGVDAGPEEQGDIAGEEELGRGVRHGDRLARRLLAWAEVGECL